MISLKVIKKHVVVLLFIFSTACIEKVEFFNKTTADNATSKNAQPEMTTYYMVFLKRGPNWTADITPEIEKVLEGHFANMEKLASEGKLALAGPFLEQVGDSALAGLFVFRVDSIEQAIRLTEQDPGIKSGRFIYEIVPWYGPKSLTY